MATSDVFTGYHTYYPQIGSRVEELVPLYTDHTTTDNGDWKDMSGVEYINYVVNGITTGTVSFRGWNGATKPAATEHGEAAYGVATSASTLVTTLTADGTISFSGSQIYRYMKAYISVGTTISLDMDMKRVRYIG